MVELAGRPPAGVELPDEVTRLIGDSEADVVWVNLDGGITVRLGRDRFLKWSRTPLDAELRRLAWAAPRLPVPRVLEHGPNWMLTAAIDGRSAVHAEGAIAARALVTGLRALHGLPVDDCPFDWSAEQRGGIDVPAIDRLVVCHGDACVPNTLVGADGQWVGLVDLGALGVADRWSDLAVASMSLGWNFGDGFEGEFFDAYGIARDELRIRFYRELWNAPDVKMDQ